MQAVVWLKELQFVGSRCINSFKQKPDLVGNPRSDAFAVLFRRQQRWLRHSMLVDRGLLPC